VAHGAILSVSGALQRRLGRLFSARCATGRIGEPANLYPRYF